MRRRRSMHPVTLPTVPGAAGVVAAPVVADAECHDAEPQLTAELKDGYAAALVVVVQIVAVHPASVALGVDVTPSPVIETAVHVQQTVGRYGDDQGVVGTRAGAHMHETLGIRRTAPGGAAAGHRQKAKERKRQTFHD